MAKKSRKHPTTCKYPTKVRIFSKPYYWPASAFPPKIVRGSRSMRFMKTTWRSVVASRAKKHRNRL
jgi:hypothetical protein